MPTRLSRFWLVLILVGGLFAQSFLASHAAAQSNSIRSAGGYASPSQRRDKTQTGKGSSSPDVWRDPVYTPPAKPSPKPARKKTRPVKVPRLTFEWRILQCGLDGADTEVSPEKIFHTGDHWRLAIRTNQNGYLYVINQTEGPDGSTVYGPKQIFPDSEIINGQDYVMKEREQLLPPRCSPDRERVCKCRWGFDDRSGRELIIVIFSRELLTDLAYNRAGGNLIKPAYVAQLIEKWERQKALGKIRQTSDPARAAKAGAMMSYAIWVTNDDLQNNRELVWVISLANAGKKAGQ